MRMARRDDRPLADSSAVKAVAGELSWANSLGRWESAVEAAQSVGAVSAPAEDAGLECPLCSLRLARKASLEEHIKSHHGETEYVCLAKGCGKRFSTTGNLARHRRRHGNLPPIKCPAQRCKYSTDAAHKLVRHMKTHREDPTHVCRHAGCGKVFATAGNLNRHARTQHLLPQVPRPGRPRRHSADCQDTDDSRTFASTGADAACGRVVEAAAMDVLLGSDARPRVVSRHEFQDCETAKSGVLEALSLFLDPTSPRLSAVTVSGEDHDELECSRLLDELARFHAAQSTTGTKH